jgi:hypothetical protein
MNMITSASCSMAPDSRRSLIIGRLSVRDSTASVQLRQRDHRAAQLLRQQPSARGRSRPSRWRGSRRRPLPHQLQVVDDDQAQLAAQLRAWRRARARSSSHRQRRGLVDVQGGIRAARSIASVRRGPTRVGELARCAGAAGRCGPIEPTIRIASWRRPSPSRRRPPAGPRSWRRARRCSSRAVLPMLGRAARTIRSPGCRPAVMRSRS